MIIADQSFENISKRICEDSSYTGDNVTVLFAEMIKGQSAILSILDGHGGKKTSELARDLLEECVQDYPEHGANKTLFAKIQDIRLSQLMDYRLHTEIEKSSFTENAFRFLQTAMGAKDALYQIQADLLKTPGYAQDSTVFQRDEKDAVFVKLLGSKVIDLRLSNMKEAGHYRHGNVDAYRFVQQDDDGWRAEYSIVTMIDNGSISRMYEMKAFDDKNELISFSSTLQERNSSSYCS